MRCSFLKGNAGASSYKEGGGGGGNKWANYDGGGKEEEEAEPHIPLREGFDKYGILFLISLGLGLGEFFGVADAADAPPLFWASIHGYEE